MPHHLASWTTTKNGNSTVGTDIQNHATLCRSEENGQYQCYIQGSFDALPAIPEESFPPQGISLEYIE